MAIQLDNNVDSSAPTGILWNFVYFLVFIHSTWKAEENSEFEWNQIHPSTPDQVKGREEARGRVLDQGPSSTHDTSAGILFST